MNGTSGFYPGKVARSIIAVLVGAFVVLPLLATLQYTFCGGDAGCSAAHWTGIFDGSNASAYRPLWTGLTNSLVLMVATVAILLLLVAPTMILINLRFPRLRRIFEFIALLPITIPAVVLVVGLRAVYQQVTGVFGTATWTLAFAYGVLILPYSVRAIQANIDAINLTTLAEAARSLGASWLKVVWRVLAPNLRTGLLAGSLIAVAVVLGEFTVASLLARENLQTALVVVNQTDSYVAVIFSLLALVFCFVLLLLIGRIGRVGTGRKEPEA